MSLSTASMSSSFHSIPAFALSSRSTRSSVPIVYKSENQDKQLQQWMKYHGLHAHEVMGRVGDCGFGSVLAGMSGVYEIPL